VGFQPFQQEWDAVLRFIINDFRHFARTSADLGAVVAYYDYFGIVMLYIICSLGREPTEIWGSRTFPTG
jgi:hypothetical protein